MDIYSWGLAIYDSVAYVLLVWKLAGDTETPEALIVGQSHTRIIVYIALTGVSHGICTSV